jgi:hypothetical protein
MNFTFIKMAFDATFGMFYLNFDSMSNILSSCAAITLGSAALFFPAFLAY